MTLFISVFTVCFLYKNVSSLFTFPCLLFAALSMFSDICWMSKHCPRGSKSPLVEQRLGGEVYKHTQIPLPIFVFGQLLFFPGSVSTSKIVPDGSFKALETEKISNI